MNLMSFIKLYYSTHFICILIILIKLSQIYFYVVFYKNYNLKKHSKKTQYLYQYYT